MKGAKMYLYLSDSYMQTLKKKLYQNQFISIQVLEMLRTSDFRKPFLNDDFNISKQLVIALKYLSH